MKSTVAILFLILVTLNASAQKEKNDVSVLDKNKKVLIVETACGECQFKLKGDDCDLAIRIDDKAYFVDGTHIDSHGDAHAKDGFCNSIRKAEVQGKIINNRFKVTYFKLIKPSKE